MINVTFRGLVSSPSNIVLLVSILLITGCATGFEPHTLSCFDFHEDSVKDTSKREEAKSFSVLPPSGDDWCIVRPGANSITFSTNRFIGQYTTQPLSKEVFASQTFIIMANTLKAKDVDISSSTAIEEFIEKWHRVGAVTQSDDKGGWYVEFAPKKGSSRFNLIKVETEVDDSYNADCVRYKTISEESNNPSFPDWVFRMKNFAVVCRHPQSDNQLIHVMYSERRRDSYENNELSKKISAEAEHTIRSLEFIENGDPDETSFNKGEDAYDSGDYTTALRSWLPLAKLGDVVAQHNLGVMYENGEGVRLDYTEALKWYRMAANSGYAPSQINLGGMYSNGIGIEKDNREARKWYLKAAEQGVAQAQYNLGMKSFNGEGVVQDYVEAERWFLKAANQGLINAQQNLGNMYFEGRGVSQDYKVAIKWYRLAAEQGSAMAQNNLGLMYRNGQGVIQDYKVAIKWYRLAAEQGYAIAQYNLGLMYNSGQGVIQDYKVAIKWYRLAAEQGSAMAQYNLGLMYNSGQGVIQDYKAAIKWFSLAAEQRHADSYYLRGKIYQERLEYDQSISDIKKTIAINPNHARALNSLAWIQSTAKNRKYRNGKEAISHAKKAVSLTNRKDATILETLAAAYAEDAQYEKAVETIREAILKLQPIQNGLSKEELNKILKFYEQEKKFY